MPIERVFLEWRRPPLHSAVEHLFQRYLHDSVVDMLEVIIVTPVTSAGRRLLELLLETAEKKGVRLDPPDIGTIGDLPEKLYTPKLPFASRLVQQLAWTRSLHDSPPERLADIVANPPEPGDATGWMNLGDLLRRQHVDLAADNLDFADVLRLGPEVEGFREVNRWRAMREVQEDYLRLLDSLRLWDLQTARLFAVKLREFQTDKDIILLGAVDLNLAVRQMLDQVADHVTALIHAPAEWTDRFDAYGCVISEKWTDAPVEIADEQVVRVDGPDEQAAAVAHRIAEYGGRYAADEITIGLPDPLLAPHVERQLYQSGVATHYFDGGRVLDSAPCRLLAAIAAYLERGRYVDFAALVRHPDLCEWLAHRTKSFEFLTKVDELYNNRLPSRLLDDAFEDPRSDPVAAQVYTLVTDLLGPFHQDSRRLHEWTRPLKTLLVAIYQDRQFDRTDPAQDNALEACVRLQSVLSEHETLPKELSPRLSAAEAMRYTLDQLTGELLPAPHKEAAIEMLGWLDLTLDDAPALLVTSFNEGLIPSSIAADIFLPNELRRRLGLADNDRRYARDAYALCSLLASREDVTLIVAKRDSESNPMPPSRLLFATDEATIAVRAKRYFSPLAAALQPHPLVPHERPADEPSSLVESSQLSLTFGEETTSHAARKGQRGKRRTEQPAVAPSRKEFLVPRPAPLSEPITALNVTSFKEYLACPYRFYLKRVLKLDVVDDAAAELDASRFGTLMHDVLEEFGQNPEGREWKDADKVQLLLEAILDDEVRKRHGAHPLPAVSVQVEQVRYRLKNFAQWQADWVAQGWRIKYTETNEFKERPYIEVDGQPMYLRARLDRVDFNARKKEWYILDYKSGEAGDTPDKIHRPDGEWHDLQLPLYRLLAKFLGVEGKIRLGYILLPKDIGRIGLAPAEWTDAELEQALDTARYVVRRVRRQEFWPPAPEPPPFSDDFAAICQDRVVGSAKRGTAI